MFKKALDHFIVIAATKSSISKQLQTKINKYNRLLNEIDSIQERLNMQHSSKNTNQNTTTLKFARTVSKMIMRMVLISAATAGTNCIPSEP